MLHAWPPSTCRLPLQVAHLLVQILLAARALRELEGADLGHLELLGEGGRVGLEEAQLGLEGGLTRLGAGRCLVQGPAAILELGVLRGWVLRLVSRADASSLVLSRERSNSSASSALALSLNLRARSLSLPGPGLHEVPLQRPDAVLQLHNLAEEVRLRGQLPLQLLLQAGERGSMFPSHRRVLLAEVLGVPVGVLELHPQAGDVAIRVERRAGARGNDRGEGGADGDHAAGLPRGGRHHLGRLLELDRLGLEAFDEVVSNSVLLDDTTTDDDAPDVAGVCREFNQDIVAWRHELSASFILYFPHE